MASRTDTVLQAAIAKRLREARERAGFETAADAVRAFGWRYDAYKHHENCMRGIPRERLLVYAKAYKVDFNWLVLGAPVASQPADVLPVIAMTILPAKRTSGFAAKVNAERHIPRPAPISSASFAIDVPDDSMLDPSFRLSLAKGDLAIISPDAEVRPGDIALIWSETEGKHLLRRARFLTATSIEFYALDGISPPTKLAASSPYIHGVLKGFTRLVE